ncbi:hypothetical protein DFH11DRAFT_1863214 [Phellopilus nigrolimitatus]|nr:hypothetical protein DFH11DRAFT_1715707 [Phellopilus nigrolimitatus]KAH8107371.1 hypothetical protein DFH11DRAFT_1863214 [Phellopilus nigrolimitatus]
MLSDLSKTGVGQNIYAYSVIGAILVYDTIIKLDKEVKYFWSSPRVFVNAVYFLLRYIGLVNSLVPFYLHAHMHETLYYFVLWTSHFAGIHYFGFQYYCCFMTATFIDWITILLIDYIFYIRVLALYSQKRKLAICLRCLLALEATLMLGVLIHGALYKEDTWGNLDYGDIFQGETRPSLVRQGLFWAAPAAYELLLMSLALYKANDFWKTSAGFQISKLVNVLIQDQAIYLVLMVTFSIIKVVVFQVPNAVLATSLNTVVGTPICSVLGCWLLFHLKEAGERGINSGSSYDLRARSLNNMRFV